MYSVLLVATSLGTRSPDHPLSSGLPSTSCWKCSSEILVGPAEVCQLYIHSGNFHHILLYWIDVWWLWKSFEYSHVQENSLRLFELDELTWHLILIEAQPDDGILRSERDGPGHQLYTGRMWCLNYAQRSKVCQKTISHTITWTQPAWTNDWRQDESKI